MKNSIPTSEIRFDSKIVSSLEKDFSNRTPRHEEYKNSVLLGERLNFQIVCKNEEENDSFKRLNICVRGALAQYVRLRTVDYVPATLPPSRHDDYYVGLEPSLYPDVLSEMTELGLVLPFGLWRAVWISVDIPKDFVAGEYVIFFDLTKRDGEIVTTLRYEVEILPLACEKPSIVLTNWMHYDCIAQQHGLEPFTDEYYEVFAEYLKAYVDCGFNMLLIPLFTPPLDTQRGGERKTCQLVKVVCKEFEYEFDFSRLEKFLRFVEKRGVKYFEFCHLYTQWGGEAAPKVLADKNGETKKIFGWETPSDEGEYVRFISCFLEELTTFIKTHGWENRSYFHLTDEPRPEHAQRYAKLREIVKSKIGDMSIMDAISSYEFYQKGLIDTCVVCTDKIDEFLDHNATDIFAYTCCEQTDGYLSNRLMHMPSERTRVLGLQLYLNDIKGFLHWGFNFYNTFHSVAPINPYLTNDAGGQFPSGDSFIVYPKKNGVCMSLRAETVKESFQDYAALQLLQSYIGRDEVVKMLINEGMYRFGTYPKDMNWYADIRRKLNERLKAVCAKE